MMLLKIKHSNLENVVSQKMNQFYHFLVSGNVYCHSRLTLTLPKTDTFISPWMMWFSFHKKQISHILLILY